MTPQVPVGAVTVAIRQIVLLSVPSPTGWRHVGQTALRLFGPERTHPFLFRAVVRAGLETARAKDGAQVIPWR